MTRALLLACLLAATPGVIVLQLLPRLVTSDAPSAALALLGTLLPLGGALLGGLLLHAMRYHSDWSGAVMGLAAQGAGLPAFWTILRGTLTLGYWIDAGVFAVLFGSYVTLGGALATLAAGPLFPSPSREERRGEDIFTPSSLRWWAQALGALTLLATALATLSNLAAPLLYPLSMSLAAGALAAYASTDHTSPRQLAAKVTLVAAAAVATLAAVLLVGTVVG